MLIEPLEAGLAGRLQDACRKIKMHGSVCNLTGKSQFHLREHDDLQLRATRVQESAMHMLILR